MVTIMLISGNLIYEILRCCIPACKRFQLHTFCSFREIAYYRKLLINSYVIFGTNGEFEKSETTIFDLYEDSLS